MENNKMGFPFDFVIHTTGNDDPDIGKKIVASLILKKIKEKKPINMFIGGDSGSGKSFTAVRFQEIVCEALGLKHLEVMEVMNVYTPIEYPRKIDKILNDKEYKKVCVLTLHEAREVIKAKEWHSFLSMCVADINAMSRSLKRVCTIIVSQFIRDITADVRYTLNFYGTMERIGRKDARLRLYALWKDDHDLHNPKLRKRRIRGIALYPDGTRRVIMPKYLSMSLPSEEAQKLFDEQDTKAKAHIIRGKIEKMIKHMEKEITSDEQKVGVIVDYYIQNPQLLNKIAKQTNRGWKLLPELRQIHDMTKSEEETFYTMLNKKLEEKGIYTRAAQEALNASKGSGDVIESTNPVSISTNP
jgi:hypothetical protein